MTEATDIQRLEMLGKGAFGVVYRAEWQGQTVAAKYLQAPEGAAIRKQIEEGLRREVKALMRLNHLNIVRFLGSSPTDMVIMTEFCERGTLRGVLDDDGVKKTPALRFNLVKDIATGMQYLHGLHPKPMLHHDLKPQNILVSGDWTAKVADFGLATGLASTMGSATKRTKAGSVWYQAPELFDDATFTTTCDVYAFGVLVAEVAHDDPAWTPWPAGTTEMKILRIVSKWVDAGEGMIDLGSVEEGPLKAIAKSCLALKPEDRLSFAEVFGKMQRLGSQFPRKVREDATLSQVLAKLDKMESTQVRQHETVLKSLTELATGEHGCPKLMLIAPPKKDKKFSLSTELSLYFLCAYSYEPVGPSDGDGFTVKHPKTWVEHWAPAITMTATLLKVGGLVAKAFTGLPLDHLVSSMGIDAGVASYLEDVKSFAESAAPKMAGMMETLSSLGERELPAEFIQQLEQRSQHQVLQFLETKHAGWRGRLPMVLARNKDGEVAWVHEKHKEAWEASSAVEGRRRTLDDLRSIRASRKDRHQPTMDHPLQSGPGRASIARPRTPTKAAPLKSTPAGGSAFPQTDHIEISIGVGDDLSDSANGPCDSGGIYKCDPCVFSATLFCSPIALSQLSYRTGCSRFKTLALLLILASWGGLFCSIAGWFIPSYKFSRWQYDYRGYPYWEVHYAPTTWWMLVIGYPLITISACLSTLLLIRVRQHFVRKQVDGDKECESMCGKECTVNCCEQPCCCCGTCGDFWLSLCCAPCLMASLFRKLGVGGNCTPPHMQREGAKTYRLCSMTGEQKDTALIQ